MPGGENLAHCFECGKSWIVGDCIPTICPECECKQRGHLPIRGAGICGRCAARTGPVNLTMGGPCRACNGWGGVDGCLVCNNTGAEPR